MRLREGGGGTKIAAMSNNDPLVRFAPAGVGIPADLTPEESRALETVNDRIAAGQSLAELLDFLFETTRSICPCDRISVALLDESGERLVSNYTRAAYEPILLRSGFAQDIQGSSLRAVVERRTPRIIPDLEAYLLEHPGSVSTRILVREGVRSSMACPLAVEGRTVGVLFRSARRIDAYDERQAALHQVVAERLSQAVEKVCRIEQLAQANRAYLEMLGFVSHELKGPLAVVNMSSEILLQGYAGSLNDKQREVAERIRTQASSLIGMVRDYLDLARIEGGDMRLVAADGVSLVEDVLEPAIRQESAAVAERRMTLERAFEGVADLRLRCDAALLRIAVGNYLSNAAKYGREGGRIRVGAEKVGEERVRVFVWNEGQGFRDADRGRLFRRFSRIAAPEFSGIRGTGIGLYSVWRIVRLHGGRAEAKSEFGKWVEFSFEIPLRADG